MIENPLKSDLDKLREAIGTSFGMLFQLGCHLKDYKKVLKDRFDVSKLGEEHKLLGSTMIIGDLTGANNKGFRISFPTGYGYDLRLGEVDLKIDILIRRESMKSIAFCYEVLETYMFDITAKYLFINSENHKQLITQKLGPDKHTLGEYTKSIRKLRGKNNRKLLSLIRKITPSFTEGESKNHEHINLRDWFEVLSVFRHGTVHSNFELTGDSKQLLTKNQISILDKYFPNEELNGSFIFNLEKEHAEKLLYLLLEYGILIFKSLSIELGSEWKVFKYMDEPDK